MKHGKRDICKVTRHEQHLGAFGKPGRNFSWRHCIWVLLSPVPGVLEAGQNGHCLLAIEASCGKLLSKIPVIICDSKSDFCLIIAHHVAIFCDLPL